MRVDATPRRLTAVPGKPAVVTVTVTNTASIISGHEIRVLGVDPTWVKIDQPQLSLFPDSSGVAVLTIALPPGIPAGNRRIDVEVRELTPPGGETVIPVELAVPADVHLALNVDPVSVTGGRSAALSVRVSNSGNAPVDADLRGVDDEAAIGFEFEPGVAAVDPGEQAVVTARLRARRPWFGSPKVRPFSIEAGALSAPVVAHGAWVQSPRLSRGAMALAGLLATATIFAVVIAATLTGLGHKSNQDLALALQVEQASTQTGGSGGAGTISGAVHELSSKAPVSGATVTLFQAADPINPVVSTATGTAGTFHFNGLTAGSYKIRFDGSGFTEVWYPQAESAAKAAAVTLQPGSDHAKVNVFLGGIPASISGQVVGGRTNGAVLILEAESSAAHGGAAVVSRETLDSSGNFSFADVPSPATYQLVVSETDFAPTSQQVVLGAGEARTGLTIQLHQGDGSIAGTVSSREGGINGATISVSDGSDSVNTVSLTKGGQRGAFVLNSLPTPANLTLEVRAPGFNAQTLSVSLASDEHVTGLDVSLTSGVGTIGGTVTTPPGTPAGGVTVVVSNGKVSKTTVTLSGGKTSTTGAAVSAGSAGKKGKGGKAGKPVKVSTAGTWSIRGLAVPGSYTVTFSRPDLQSQTRAVQLSAASPGATVNTTLTLNRATLHGTVRQHGIGPIGDVTVTANSGTRSYTVTTATTSGPGTGVGSYEIEGIVPGTYTLSFSTAGVLPMSTVIDLTAGADVSESPTLQASASITGRVVFSGTTTPAAGAEVRLYLTNQYPNKVAAQATVLASGSFDFTGVQAPDSYIIGVAYPAGTPDQETVRVTTVPQQAVEACQQAASGGGPTTTTTKPKSTTTSTTASTTTTTAPNGTSAKAGGAKASTTSSSSTTTSTSTTTTTTTTVPTGGPACQPLEVLAS